MGGLVVILMLVMLATGAALVVLGRRSSDELQSSGQSEPPDAYEREAIDRDAFDRVPEDEPRRPSQRVTTQPPAVPARAGATATRPATVPRAPEVFAVLEFDDAPWNVTMTRPEVVIGRHTQADIRLSDIRVSRHHARLVALDDGGFEILNLTAERPEPNPMLVNGRTRERADIAIGDIVTLGGISFKLKAAA